MSKPSLHTLESYHATYKSVSKSPSFLRRCARMARREAGVLAAGSVKPKVAQPSAAPDWLKHVNAYLDKLLASLKLLPK